VAKLLLLFYELAVAGWGGRGGGAVRIVSVIIAYLLTDRALGTGGGHFVAIDLLGNIDGSVNAFGRLGCYVASMGGLLRECSSTVSLLAVIVAGYW
jgi:hypothetical protein